MSAEKKHDYHLVDPSPWPIYVSFSCLVLAIGAVYYMHSDVSWGMYLGLALLIYGAYMWFRDVVIEAEHQGHHTPVVQIHHRYGMTLFIASEVMFFVAWFWAYFDVSLFPNDFVGNVWPPKDIVTFDPWDIPLINTLVLLLSGTTVTWSHHSLLEGDRKGFIQGLVLTVILGAFFTDLNSNINKVDKSKFTDKPVCIIIGPEGDFSETEREKILSFKGVQPVKINENILRSETAVISAISIVNYVIN